MRIPPAENLIAFSLAATALVAVPGPNHFYVVSRTVLAGRRSGLTAAVGIEVGTGLHIGLAAVGLSQLLAASPGAMQAVTMTGAGYLLYLAFRALRHSSMAQQPRSAAAPSSWFHELLKAAAVNVLNPKVILFFVAFLTPFLDQAGGDIPSQVLSYGVIVLALGLISNLTYALAASTLSALTTCAVSSRTVVGRLQAGAYLILALVAMASTALA